MPSIHPGCKVLVTGANGYLGMWIVQKLLDRGYSVRGTVRSASRGVHVQEHFNGYGDRFEISIVPDIAQENAFSESLDGVSAVIHPATPLPNPKIEKVEDYIKPAVEGTLGVMKTSLQLNVLIIVHDPRERFAKRIYSPNVKRIVYTSTLGTIMKQVTEPTTVTEDHWNDEVVAFVKEQGANAHIQMKYFASKVLAEKAALELYEKNRGTSPYDFLVLNAPYIFGPAISEVEKGSGSFGDWFNHCVGNPTEASSEDELAATTPYVDVRDLADLHVAALINDKAVGERFIIRAGFVPTWQNWIDIANKIQSDSRPLPKGTPGIKSKDLLNYDPSKEARVFGTQFRPAEETARDMLKQFAQLGWY